jgi:uncharacterized membrane protein
MMTRISLTTRLLSIGAAAVLAVSLGAAVLTRRVSESPPSPGHAGMRAPADVRRVVERACRDCHSDETRWPWYSRFAPVSWLVEKDVEQGRRFLNFSRWERYPPSRKMAYLAAIAAAASTRVMPPQRYVIMHNEARLTLEERQLIAGWARREYRRVRQPDASGE